MSKKEWSNLDAQPVVLYGKQTDNEVTAYPFTLGPNGELLVNSGLLVPLHDEEIIDTANPSISTITYKFLGVGVGIKTITVSGSTTTVTMT